MKDLDVVVDIAEAYEPRATELVRMLGWLGIAEREAQSMLRLALDRGVVTLGRQMRIVGRGSGAEEKGVGFEN